MRERGVVITLNAEATPPKAHSTRIGRQSVLTFSQGKPEGTAMTAEAWVAEFVRSVTPSSRRGVTCIAQSLRLGSGSNKVMARNATAGLSQTRTLSSMVRKNSVLTTL